MQQAQNKRKPSSNSNRKHAAWLLLLLFLLGGCKRDDLVDEPREHLLPADGRLHRLAELRRKSGDALAARDVGRIEPESKENPELIFEQLDSHTVEVLVRTPVTPGDGLIPLVWRGKNYSIQAQYLPAEADGFGDGTPDFLRLHSVEDRKSFRAWLSAIAEQEAEQPAPPAEIKDCAALLRFAYREALVEHDEHWLGQQSAPARMVSLASISQYHYPQTPLAAALFRVKAGPFAWRDLSDGSFAQFADARTLMQWNTYFVSRDLRAALPGDLLFFRQLGQNSPYHSMIVTGGHAEWLVYHTGPIGKRRGEIRRIAVEDLMHHPDARWRPVPGNSNYLGVYRWNILRDGG